MNFKPAPFEVPDGYFEKLEKDILAKTTVPNEAIFGAKDTPVSSPFNVPKEYFEQSAQNILAKTSQQFPKKLPFYTPNVYFETLLHQILKKISYKKPNVFWSFFQKIAFQFNQYLPVFFPRKQVFYPLMFMFLGVFGFYFSPLTPKGGTNHKVEENAKLESPPKSKEEKNTKNSPFGGLGGFKNNSENQLNLSAQNTSKTVTNNKINQVSKINENLAEKTKSLDEQLQFISKQDLEEYLKSEEMNTNDILEMISNEQSAMMIETILLGREEHEEELRHKKEQEINQLLHEIHEMAE